MVATLVITHGHGSGAFGSLGPGSGSGTAIVGGGGGSTGFGNLSFEEPKGTYPTLHANNTSPYALGIGYNLRIVVNGVEHNVAFYPGTHGYVNSGVSGPFDMSGGSDTLDVSFDGLPTTSVQWVQGTAYELVLDSSSGPTYALYHGATLIVKVNTSPSKTVVFREEDFADISAATQSEVAAVLSLALLGVSVAPTGPSSIELVTDLLGDSASIQILGGTGASAFTTASTTAGVGNVQDITAVSAAEVVIAVNTATTQSLSVVGPGDSVSIVSASYGTTSTVVISGGSAAALFAFALPVDGTDLIADMDDVQASEISAALEAANTGLTAVMDGFYLVLTTFPQLQGDIATIEVIGGAANVVFGFPTNVISRGQSDPGYARLWSMEVLSQGWELAEFAESGPSLFPSAYEMFAKGWPASTDPDAFTDASDISGSTVTGAFWGLSGDGPFLWETMDWFPFYTDITATIAVVFNTTTYPDTTGVVETFGNGYRYNIGPYPSNYYDVVDWDVRLTLTWLGDPFNEVIAMFNSDTLEEETFNTEWGFKTSIPSMGNERDIYDIDDLGPERELHYCDFSQPGIVETFSPANPEHTDILINACTVGNIYSVTIDGIRFSYVAQMGDTEFIIAQELVSNINNGNTVQTSAYQFAFHVVLLQEVPGTPMTVEIDGTNPSEISIVEDHFVMPSYKWPGKYWNPSLV
jgi:hypothetical protein